MTISLTFFLIRNIIHNLQQIFFHNRPQTARTGFTLNRFFGYCFQSFLGNRQFNAFHIKQSFILLNQSILRLGQNPNQSLFIQII